MKHLLAGILLISATAALAQAPARVVVAPISAEPRQATLTLTGTTRAARHAQLSSLSEGVVVALHAETGDRVTEGQLLLELDAALARAQVNSLKASLAQADVMRQEAARQLKEAQTLSERQFVAQTELAERQARLATAEANLARVQADYTYQRELLARHRLYAPFAGVIAQRNIDVGEWLNRGDATFELVSNQTLWLDVAVPQEYHDQIDTRASVPVQFDALAGNTYQARVLASIPVVDATNRSFLLRLALPEAPALQVGLSARVQIPLNHRPGNSVLIPSDALLRQPDGNFSVFVVHQERAHRRSVQIGQRVNGHIEVIAGIEPGQSVVTQGNELLKDGQAVEVIDASSEAH